MATPPSGSSRNQSIFVLLRYIVDQKSEHEIAMSMSRIRKSGSTWDDQLRRTYTELDRLFLKLAADIDKIQNPKQHAAFTQKFAEIQNYSKGMMTTASQLTGSNVPAIFELIADKVKQVTQEIRKSNVEEQQQVRLIKEAEAAERAMFKEAFRFGIAGRTMTRFGQTLANFGQTILSPMKSFTDLADKTDPVFQRWNRAANEMQGAVARIGRTMLETWLPTIERLASLMESISKVVEAHPWIAGIVAIAGGVTYGLGKLLVTVGQMFVGMSAIHALKGLVLGGQLTAAAKAGIDTEAVTGLSMLFGGLATKMAAFKLAITGAITSVTQFAVGFGETLLAIMTSAVGAVLSGLVIGALVNDWIASLPAAQARGAQPVGRMAGEVAVTAAHDVGSLFGEDKAYRWSRNVAEAFGFITDESGKYVTASQVMRREIDKASQAQEDYRVSLQAYYQDMAKNSTGFQQKWAAFWVWALQGATKAEEAATAFDEQWSLIAKDATRLYQQFTDAQAKAMLTLNEDLAKAEEKYQSQVAKTDQKYDKDRIDEQTKYAEERVKIEADYEKQRNQTVDDYNAERARKEEDFRLDQERALEDYNRAVAQALADYNTQVARLQQDTQQRVAELESKYYKDVEKAKEDHLKRLRDMERDYTIQEDELIAARDFMALKDLRRKHAAEVDKENEDYQDRLNDLKQNLADERAAIQTDYQQRLAEMEQQFAIEQQRRAEDFQRKQAQEIADKALEDQRAAEDQAIRLTELEKKFQEEMKQADEDHKQKLEDLAKNYQEERKQLLAAKVQELKDLRDNYEKQRKLAYDELKAQMADLLGIVTPAFSDITEAAKAMAADIVASANLIKGATGTNTPAPTKAGGGYVSGLIHTGEQGPEFLMTRGLTTAAEKVVGGQLTQANVLAALSGSARTTNSVGGVHISLSQRMDFHGALTAAERDGIRKMVRRETQHGILDAIGGV
jgi:hypothetical protein